MNRQRFLVLLLILLAVALVPYYLAAQAAAEARRQLELAGQGLELAKQKAEKMEEMSAELEAEERAMAELDRRLLGDQPFAEMERALSGVADETAVRVVDLTLSGAQPVESLQAFVEYTAEVEVEGSTEDFIRFLRRLEAHPLLIAIPDLTLEWPDGPTLRTRLVLRFYGKAPGNR